MHSFIDLVERSLIFSLQIFADAEKRIVDEDLTGASSIMVRNLQMIKLQKVISAIGMLSVFEAILQDRLEVEDGFAAARNICIDSDRQLIWHEFEAFRLAVNVLKHGHGRSYDELRKRHKELPFKIKNKRGDFFEEGDVSEITTLIYVDDKFLQNCAGIIKQLAHVIEDKRPETSL